MGKQHEKYEPRQVPIKEQVSIIPNSDYLDLGVCSIRKDRISFYQVDKNKISLIIGGAEVIFVKDISFVPSGILLSEIQFSNLKEFLVTLK